MTAAFILISTLAMVVFTIAMIVIWIRNRHEVGPYVQTGLKAGLVLVALDLAILPFIGPLSAGGVVFLLLADLLVGLKIAGFVVVGMLFAHQLGLPGLRLSAPQVAVAQPSVVVSTADASLLLPNPAAETPAPKEPAGYLPGLVVACVGVIYSLLLFWLMKPSQGELFATGAEEVFSLAAITTSVGAFLAFAFGEEIIFRHGIQNMLAKFLGWRGGRYWIAIAVTSALWTLGHAGALDPNWIKFAQIFPLGLLFGWLYLRYGLQSSILAHAVFNLIMVLFLPVYAIYFIST